MESPSSGPASRSSPQGAAQAWAASSPAFGGAPRTAGPSSSAARPAGSGAASGRGASSAAARAAEPGRILLVRLGAIGDCLRVLPSLALLRDAFPAAEIGWAIGDLAEPLVRGHPDLTRLHVLRRAPMKAGPLAAAAELRRLGKEIREAGYDVAIDLHTRLKSGYLVRASRAPLRIGLDFWSGTEANFLFTNCHVRLDDIRQNRVTRFAGLLAPLGIDAGLVRLPPGLWVEPSAAARAAAMLEEAGRPAVAIFPGTSSHRSGDRWPAANWKLVVAGLAEAGLTSMVLWGPGEMDVAGEIASASSSCTLAPPTTLPEMAALLGHFRLYVGSNTAALHMAWMQGVPAVVLAGGRPWRTDRPMAPVPSMMLTAGGLEPERKLRGSAARRAVEGITVGEVLAAARRLLGPAAIGPATPS